MNEFHIKNMKRSRLMYIFEAALEYFISILVAGSYLATLTKELGFSDSLTGILSSFISLGCLFQLLSLSIRRTKVKRFVIISSIINQLLFMLLYLIPLTGFDKQVKIVLFVIFIFSAFLFYNFAHPKKINWLMSLVEDKQRGNFTANKEIISLVSGMAFTFAMGAVVDHFSETGRIRTAFVLSAVVIFILMVLHSLTMIFAVEKEIPHSPPKKLKQQLSELLKNKSVIRVTIVFILHNISTYISTPFYSTYQIGELGLSLKFVSVIVMCGSISRISVSKFWGRYADKNNFAVMLEKCFIFSGISQIFVIFAVPAIGKIFFALYYIFHGIALGGINSALINLIFDYVPIENRADSLAVTQAIAGLVGFSTTLCISPLVSYIQNNNNSIFGFPIYAQQFVSIISLVFTITAILYTRYFFIKKATAKA